MDRTPGARLLVSIVVPMLDEAENISRFSEHLTAVCAANPDYDFELVAVDDGSSDDTAALLEKAIPPQVSATIIRLSRNFGSHYALSAGFDAARGDCAIAVGADLQEPPELISSFLAEWERGFEVVWGVRRTRAETGPRSWPSRIFSRLFARYSEIETYPAEGPSGALVDRAALDAVAGLRERNRNVYGLIAWAGFNQTRVEYDQLPRVGGTSKWTSRKLVKLAFDSFVQFSSTPIRAAGLLGFLFAGIGFLYAFFLVVRALVGAAPPEGWTTVVVIVLIMGGIQLMVLGVFGEYLWRSADEARNRPLYVVRNTRRIEADDDV
jgi:glycosyltransferase involved in cell wall biosynthesis